MYCNTDFLEGKPYSLKQIENADKVACHFRRYKEKIFRCVDRQWAKSLKRIM
jgi:hypothetical protein